jgi:hypothetical protein
MSALTARLSGLCFPCRALALPCRLKPSSCSTSATVSAPARLPWRVSPAANARSDFLPYGWPASLPKEPYVPPLARTVTTWQGCRRQEGGCGAFNEGSAI